MITEDLIQEALKLPVRGRVILRKQFGISDHFARKLAAICKEREKSTGGKQAEPKPENTNKITFEQKKDGEANLTGQAKSLDELLKKANVDLEYWEVDTYEIKENAWDVTMQYRDQDLKWTREGDSQFMEGHSKREPGGVTKTNRQFYIKVRLKKRTDFTSTQKFRRQIIEELKHFSPIVKPKQYKPKTKSNLLEINIPDLHLGKLSWAEETGFQNYDIKIAEDRFRKSFDWLLNQATRCHDFERCLFIVGNDLFNSDGNYPYSATTHGTPQQDDVRWQKVFKIGRRLMYESILKLSEFAPVDVLVVPGNHDFQKAFYLGEALEGYFENNPNVNINNSPRTRKYYNWGKCLLGFAHGSRKDEGEARLFSNMQHEAPRELNINWADITFKEWHCGDIHHYKELKAKGTNKVIDKYAEDIDGIMIKYLRTLMFNDEWEAKKGYISQKGAHCFIWNKEDGNIAEYKYNRYE